MISCFFNWIFAANLKDRMQSPKCALQATILPLEVVVKFASFFLDTFFISNIPLNQLLLYALKKKLIYLLLGYIISER